ncbi:MAG: hypothetical protein IJY84_02945 [Clostridia bacterium]|nr:hypothetical protein [Clostridia bacterium]
MTNKVYPIRQPLASLAVLVSKPLNGLKAYLLRKSALLLLVFDPNDQQGLLCPQTKSEPSFARI